MIVGKRWLEFLQLKIPLRSLKRNLAHYVEKHNAATVYGYRNVNDIEDWILKHYFYLSEQ